MGGNDRFVLQVYVGTFSNLYEALSIEASKQTTAEDIVECIADKLGLKESNIYELAEVVGNEGGQDCKERRLGTSECPVALQLLWPRRPNAAAPDDPIKSKGQPLAGPEYRFCLRRKLMHSMNWSFSWTDSNDSQLLKDYFLRFLYQPRDREYPDLCQLADLTEQTLLENLKARFEKGHIYTYVGSILIAVNPFKFYPIYNPKYVQLYQNRRLGELPPHIFAIADASYQAMLKKRCNQVIVISGESGSGKTESTNLLLHHLTALSQKGSHGSGIEQCVLGSAPVLEAFGNAKTKHNNNSSRFGKFIQVNYRENGMVHGAIVQKYLLEKSRIVSQAKNERNYHVFYYLLAGSEASEKEHLHLTKPSDYYYLNQSKCYTLEGVDEAYELSRLKQSLEMVGFSAEKQKKVLAVLAAVLHLGNVEFSKKSTYHNDETVIVKNPSVVSIISKLLMVREENLLNALTCKRTKAAKGETIIINYKMAEAVATRDAMAKCLYGSLFDWLVMQLNQALLSKQDIREHKGHYIGVLDIFGFEDFGDQNYFEQFCINFANEYLHNYFNQHVFKYEQEEYQREGIKWNSIEYTDNSACLDLIEARPYGLLCLLDDQCSFPGATNETMLQKFVNHHNNNPLFEVPPCRQSAFVIKHYAGKVKYQIKDFREKNTDLMRPDIVCLIKGSSAAFVRELVGNDILAIFRWQILKAFFRAYFIFSKIREQSKKRRDANESSSTAKNTVSVIRRLGIGDKKSSSNNNNDATMHVKSSNAATPRCESHAKSPHSGLAKAGANCAQCFNGSLVRVASSPCPLHGLTSPSLNLKDSTVLQRANRILQKNKINRTPSLKNQNIEKSVKSLQTLKLIVGKTTYNPQPRAGRKQTNTVTFQFQQSLHLLMETLHQANPFFVRCIKSNAEKAPNHLDDMLVLLQLRYTGMLETVRIRQSGYSVRLTFEEFIQHYRILLSKGLLSSQIDIKEFLSRQKLNHSNYQMGQTKIFMKESEKLALDNLLHQEILKRIITLQRWVRTWITRRRFLQMKNAAVCLQSYTRRWIAQQRLTQLKQIFLCENAATSIQRTWRAFKERKGFVKLRQATISFQAHARGFLSRKEFQRRWSQHVMQRDRHKGSTATTVTGGESSQRKTSETITELFEDTRPLAASSSKATAISSDIESIISKATESTDLQQSLEASSAIKDASPPPLPPRKSSSAHLPPQQRDSITDIYADDGSESSLNRRRNKPLRKLSIKRSKSIAKEQFAFDFGEGSVSPPQTAPYDSARQKMPLREMASEPAGFSQLGDSFGRELESTGKHQEGAFEKAKKHIRTLMGGKERKLKESKADSEDRDEPIYPNYSSHKASINSDISLPSPSSLSPTDNIATLANAYKQFTFQNHHKLQPFSNSVKSDICASCEQSAYSANVSKCINCGLVFHGKCTSSCDSVPCMTFTDPSGKSEDLSLARQILATKPSRPPRKGKRKQTNHQSKSQRSSTDSGRVQQSGSSWNVTRTAEFTDPKDVLITDVSELHYMETFIGKKINSMEDSARAASKESAVDVMFKNALKEFKTNLISTYSVATPDQMHISYKNLIDHFEEVMKSTCSKENKFQFPIILGVNAFRGFLDEFRTLCAKQNLGEKSGKQKGGGHKRKRAKLKKDKSKEEAIETVGHTFRPVQANIPTVCEVCSSLVWLMEKIWVCQGCKLTCHKKCTAKVQALCRENRNQAKNAKIGIFGVPLAMLVSDDCRVPQQIEELITVIELKGLYTEGIYRKSGTTSKINELKGLLDRNDNSAKVDYDSYSVHVLTATLKAFFRELPDPLMTFDLYNDFLWSTAITDPQERVSAIYSHIAKLPRPNYDLLERLLFHLARVAQQESSNRMNANSLAIVFAPCVLRTDRPMHMQDKISDITKQVVCLQAIIADRVKQICDTLADIDILDSAFRTASSRLSSLRQSKLYLNSDPSTSNGIGAHDEEEEVILKQQIETLRFEKVHLTNMLPSFRMASAGESDDDQLVSVPYLDDTTVGAALDEPGSPGPSKPFKLADIKLVEYPQNLRHLTKGRVSLPTNRRLPSRFKADGSTTPGSPRKYDSERSSEDFSATMDSSSRRSSESGKKSDSELCSNVEEKLFRSDDKPVTV